MYGVGDTHPGGRPCGKGYKAALRTCAEALSEATVPKLPAAGELTRRQKELVSDVRTVVEAAAGGEEGLPRLLAEVGRSAGVPRPAQSALDRAKIVLERAGELFALQGNDHEGRRYILQLVAGLYSLGELHELGFKGLGKDYSLLRSAAAHVSEKGIEPFAGMKEAFPNRAGTRPLSKDIVAAADAVWQSHMVPQSEVGTVFLLRGTSNTWNFDR